MKNTLLVLCFIIFLPFILLYVIVSSGIDSAYKNMKKDENNS